ncbi:hypothetical protein B0O99DRAFT_572012 [Bisporella sp. PMI_857]|nr:hypothetical protein B0O99DRAFT_572012 [Bisporella sp. PMI_857]
MGLMLKTERDEIVGSLPPPPGVIPDFEHPESRGYQVIIAIAVLFPLATLFLVLRIYTRAIIVRNVGSDDYVNLGMGVHLWNVPLTTFSPHFLKMAVVNGVFYGLSFLCVKVSILLLYLRLSPYYLFRIAVWVVMVTTAVYSVFGSFAFLFNCQPIAKTWDITITDGRCINVSKIAMTHASLTIVTDIAMLILPIALVRKLKLPIKQRVGLASVFMAGTFVCIVSSIRMKVIMEFVRTADFTRVLAEATVWRQDYFCILLALHIMEVCIGVICACLASFKPFLRRHFPRLLGSSVRSDAFRTHFSRTTNTAPNASISRYELESFKGCRKSGIPSKSKQQSCTNNESQEDILGDGYLKNIARANGEATALDAGPLQEGSFRSGRIDVLPVSREGF